MNVFADFLARIADPRHRSRTEALLGWVGNTFPSLVPAIKWNQPMFTDHGTFIIGFSVAKRHLAVAPEIAAIDRFAAAIDAAGYPRTKHLIQVPWEREVDFSLLTTLISFNIEDKADCDMFWRK